MFCSYKTYLWATFESDLKPPLDMSWKNYIEKCGREAYLSNNIKAHREFNKFYQDQVIYWEGAFVNMTPIFNSRAQILYYKISIKMIPSDSPNVDIHLKYSRNI